jgi:hypothetical protein
LLCRIERTQIAMEPAMPIFRSWALMILIGAATPIIAAETPPFDSQPWIEDLQQIKQAFAEKYANLEWAVFEREANLPELFATTETRLRAATSDEAAKAAIDRLTRILGDGHVRVQWPALPSTTPPPSDVCLALGYDAGFRGRPLGPHIAGYQPLPDDIAPAFPAGVVNVGQHRVGVIRIGLFAPQAFPELCSWGLQTLAIPQDVACDAECSDRLHKAIYGRLSRDLANRIRALKELGATILLIDLTGNGGGSEWAEAVARIVSPLKLRSARLDFVRGKHWTTHWESIGRDLRSAAAEASPADRTTLDNWAQQVDRAKSEAATSCSSTPFWSGQRTDCAWLGKGFYATGLLAEADAAALRTKPWGSLVFSPAQYEFEEAVWRGPELVLVDGGTGSASEEFVALLQDNHAAIIIGAPTSGSGCGYTDGGTPTTLTHSGGILKLPDCARIRSDGSNEVRGIDPDVLIGFRSTDGMRRKGLRLDAALPEAAAAAIRLCKRERCSSIR